MTINDIPNNFHVGSFFSWSLHHQNRGAWKLANFRNLALTCHAPCTLNSNFINFHTSNGFLPNITIVPYIKTFPTITHMIMFGFFRWDFRRDECLGQIVKCTWNLDAQANSKQTTRPFHLGLSSACIWHCFWALCMIMQVHASGIQNSCTQIIPHFPCQFLYK